MDRVPAFRGGSVIFWSAAEIGENQPYLRKVEQGLSFFILPKFWPIWWFFNFFKLDYTSIETLKNHQIFNRISEFECVPDLSLIIVERTFLLAKIVFFKVQRSKWKSLKTLMCKSAILYYHVVFEKRLQHCAWTFPFNISIASAVIEQEMSPRLASGRLKTLSHGLN